MNTREKKRVGRKTKKAAAASAVALLTAASVVTGSLFASPAALLPDDGAPVVAYDMAVGPDGAEDDGAGAGEDESKKTRGHGGVRAALRQRMLRLPLAVRLLVILPLWALGSVILAAAGAAWPLLSPALGRAAGFALTLLLLAGAFLLAAKAAFPDLPLKKIANRRTAVLLLLGAAAMSVADAILPAVWEEYEQAKNAVLSAMFFLALSAAAAPFALRERKRRLSTAKAEAERAKKPDKLVFTDGVGTFTVRVPEGGR